MDIAYNSSSDSTKPGFQTFISNVDDPSVTEIKKSFLSCCRDYFRVDRKDEMVKMWFYQDWKSNPYKTGKVWHDHADHYYGLSGVLYLNLPQSSETTSFSIFNDIMRLPSLLYKWFLYPSILPHLPGSWEGSDERRICIAADYWFGGY
tara:strand:+ start:227 stop:670 length:444 start_codon:yes stop_codon:yes gene_type:complete